MKYVKPMAEDVKLLLSDVILASVVVTETPAESEDTRPGIGDGDVNLN